jgi:hypothetical protein
MIGVSLVCVTAAKMAALRYRRISDLRNCVTFVTRGRITIAGEWGKTFLDQAMTVSAIDRLRPSRHHFEDEPRMPSPPRCPDHKRDPGRLPARATIKESTSPLLSDNQKATRKPCEAFKLDAEVGTPYAFVRQTKDLPGLGWRRGLISHLTHETDGALGQLLVRGQLTRL